MKKRIFKMRKNFQLFSKEEGDEFYRCGIFEFNITRLLAFIESHQETFQPEDLSVKSVRTFPPSDLDESRVKNADITKPIIVAEIAPDRFNIIDGNHRLEKAYRNGEENILAYRVHAEQHIAFLTSVTAYESYIEYWNEKIKQT